MTGPSIAEMMGHIRRREAFTVPMHRTHVSEWEAKALRIVNRFLNRYWTAESFGLDAIKWRPGKHFTGGEKA